MCSGVGVGGAGWDLTEGAQGGPAGNGPRPGDWEQPERAAAPGCGQAMLGPGAARAALPGTSSGCIPSAARRPFSSCARGGPVLPTCARRSGNLPMSPALFWLRPAALPLQAGPTCLVLGLGVRVSLSVLQDTLQKRRPVRGRGVTLLPVSLLWLPWTSPRNHYPRFCPPLLATEPPPTCPPSLCPWSIWHQTPAPTQALSLTLPAAETPPHTRTHIHPLQTLPCSQSPMNHKCQTLQVGCSFGAHLRDSSLLRACTGSSPTREGAMVQALTQTTRPRWGGRAFPDILGARDRQP